ncbi:hypothetical protein L1987_06511 [Smallanthus sonchifolius]|uniref:Uncharacterized protein n=1 Tax=Smallanthus sonchifolius TaxID=185202 RepID=A0ACB9JYC4_9ASTR|nr:hypothetical protein L1987_06511 [Smallanthus sonchifolius]
MQGRHKLFNVALAFQVKEYIKCEVIKKKEHDYIERALKRLVKHSNIWVLGNTQVERQAILSFLVYTTTYSNKRDKPLNGTFVAKLLNDIFGIQARGGCACAGPYGHFLLGIDDPHSLAIRSAVKMVRVPKANTQQKVLDYKTIYALYLEVAKHIGNMLPEFPFQSTLPKDIDSSYVFFQH